MSAASDHSDTPDTDNPDAAPDAPVRPAILQVLPALETGGVERGTVDVAGAIAASGFRSLVASSGGAMVRELERKGAEHITLPLATKNPLNLWRNTRLLRRLIRDEGVVLAHARSRAPAWSTLWACRAENIHFVTTFHGTYTIGPGGLKRPYNVVMAKGERVIAISEFIARHMQEVYQTPEDRIRIIHRGVDLDRFDPARVSAPRIYQLAERWRLPDGAPVVMLPGRLTRWKGQTVLVEAVALLRESGLRCLLVGSDQGRSGYRSELEEQIRKLDVEDMVHIVDHCDDMPAAYMLTDVVVSASLDPEAFGRVMAEAQAMGRPVIATNHGAAPEIVLPGRTGWLVPPGDAGALAEALVAALTLDEGQRLALAQDAMANARSRFGLQRMLNRTLGVYRELLRDARAG